MVRPCSVSPSGIAKIASAARLAASTSPRWSMPVTMAAGLLSPRGPAVALGFAAQLLLLLILARLSVACRRVAHHGHHEQAGNKVGQRSKREPQSSPQPASLGTSKRERRKRAICASSASSALSPAIASPAPPSIIRKNVENS